MARLVDVIVPANQEGTKASVLKWCKAAGDLVAKDEPLLELETDKVTVEIASPAGGELAEILKQPDEDVRPGEVLARVRIAADAPAATANSAANTPATVTAAPNQGRDALSPSVRRLLAENALAATEVAGSGRCGRVTAQDVTRHVEARLRAVPRLAGDDPAPASSRVPHTPIRRRIGEHMMQSLLTAPHVTTLFEADLTGVLAHRARHVADFERQGVRLTLTAYFIAACAQALKVHREVNATFHDDALELHADADIGVGTALGNEGLIVPVIHRAQGLSLLDLARRLGQVVAAARSGTLTPAQVRGGTFTISNHGVGGSLLAAPIVINQPQVAILGVGKVQRRVCVLPLDGAEAISVRSMCYLTLTIDHRALDAFQANSFLATVVSTLEQWPPG
jgi:2-oxoglutarate dehydrogenase E2 component (dihydrolipoamide succinyltransferase)